MESTGKDNSEDVEPFVVMDRWPNQPEGFRPRVIPWQNILATVRRGFVEFGFPNWTDLAAMPNRTAARQLKHRLVNGTLRKELPKGNWSFDVIKREDGRIILQGSYHWNDNWNALLGTPGLMEIEHKFFRRFRQAGWDKQAHMEVALDWFLWMGGLDHVISPLDSIGIERLLSEPD